MTFLVDSDWVISYLGNRRNAVTLLDSLVVEGLAISIVTYAEVYEGIYYGRDPASNEAAFRHFLRGVRVLGINRTTARRFAMIHGRLRAQGLLIPPPDLVIAATAIQHDLTLMTWNMESPTLPAHSEPQDLPVANHRLPGKRALGQ